MTLPVYQDYLGCPMMLGRDGKCAARGDKPAKVPKPPKVAKAMKKPVAPLPEVAAPAAIDGEPESVTG